MREQRKVLVGRVLSNRMDKTVVVEVRQRNAAPAVTARSSMSEEIQAHDENNACKIGDLVRMIEFRPLSREKRWKVTEIVETGVEPTSADEVLEVQSGVEA